MEYKQSKTDPSFCGSSLQAINSLKQFLSQKFHMKDLGQVRYFLGLEIDKSPNGIFLSQKKYITDTLKEHKLFNVKPLQLPIDSHIKLSLGIGDPLSNPTSYQ